VIRRSSLPHQAIADGLRALPGQWGEVGNYHWLKPARGAAYQITVGRMAAYRPAGDFESEIRFDDEGDPHVYARYIGAQGATA